jgi:hypothetical protein
MEGYFLLWYINICKFFYSLFFNGQSIGCPGDCQKCTKIKIRMIISDRPVRKKLADRSLSCPKIFSDYTNVGDPKLIKNV